MREMTPIVAPIIYPIEDLREGGGTVERVEMNCRETREERLFESDTNTAHEQYQPGRRDGVKRNEPE